MILSYLQRKSIEQECVLSVHASRFLSHSTWIYHSFLDLLAKPVNFCHISPYSWGDSFFVISRKVQTSKRRNTQASNGVDKTAGVTFLATKCFDSITFYKTEIETGNPVWHTRNHGWVSFHLSSGPYSNTPQNAKVSVFGMLCHCCQSLTCFRKTVRDLFQLLVFIIRQKSHALPQFTGLPCDCLHSWLAREATAEWSPAL